MWWQVSAGEASSGVHALIAEGTAGIARVMSVPVQE